MGDLVINKKNGIIELFNTAPFCTVTKAELSRSILSDDYIDITVESSEKLDLNLEDRIIVEGRSYFVNLLPQVKKNAEDSFTYDIRFFGASSILRRNILFNRDSQGGKTDFEFPVTAELNAFLYLIINNANEFENNWVLGDFPANTTTKTISFQKENCLAALQRVCQEFNVEFEVEETGGKFVLHIREKIGKLLPFKVEYGMGNGLYDLTRARANDSEVVTILYGYGSSENIPVKYRGYSPRLRMPIAIGDYITNQAAQELFGKVVGVFDPDIKPEFKGIVSGVGSLTNGLQEISVSNMDFDLKEKESDGKTTKYLIAGTPAKISVTKGNLAGYDFEINDYDHSSKTFKIKQFADDRGQKFPDNTTVFKFAAGDEFTLGEIVLPDQHIVNAEQKLYDETIKEYQKVSQNNVKYTLNVDPLFLQDKGEIGIGDLLPIKDADFGIDKASRIISLKKDLLTDTYTSFDVADSYEISLVKEIVNNIKDLQKEIASQKVINRQSYLDGYRRVEDRFSMYFDADGKMDGSHIKADTIDVGMLSSGSKSRWFQLEEVVFTPNLGSDPNSFRATAGRLVHFGIKTSAGAERVWNLSALTVSNLLNQGYYVYAKCDINGDYGTFVITPDRIVFDSQPNYYHFLIGNLYTASSGGRAFDANYGVSQMNGRMIFAGVISDIQGRPMIDLDKREIIGKVTFTNDSPALNQVQEKIDAVQVGTRNLFLKSKHRMPLATGDGSFELTADGVQFHNVTSYVAYGRGLISDLDLGAEYTISIKYRSGSPFSNNFYWYINDLNSYKSISTVDTEGDWNIISDTRTIVGDRVVNFHLYVPHGEVTIDWIVITKGNKGVNDWTPTPEEVTSEITIANQNAANAQNTANTAAQNAIDANKKLSDIANDNIVTPQEKPDTLKEWKQIEAERPKLIAQAGTYNINTDNYNNYYVALANYLTNSGVFLDMSVSTNVDGREFKNNFQNYYDVRQDLLKAVSDAAKAYASGLVDNIKIGGRNTYKKSTPIDTLNVDFQRETPDAPNGFYAVGRNNPDVNNIRLWGVIDGNGEWTVSWEMRGTQSVVVGLAVDICDNGIQYFSSTPDNSWKKYSLTVNVNNHSADVYNFVDFSQLQWAYYLIRNIKIEKGNKATDWTPAPEDVQEQLTNAQNSANVANQKLADIANDNRLTPSEKQDTLKEWTVIVNEVPIIKDQAATYAVSSVNYDGHYVNLSNYLTNNGLLNDLNSTSDIDGVTFRLYFKNYYGAKVDLLRNISTASKNYTNQAAGELRNEARLKLLAAQYANGNCLYRDVDFRTGLNGLNIYNNLGNGTVEVFNWTASSVNAPTKSPNIVICRYNGGGASPNLGGFYFGAPTRANAVLVVRLIMRLDIGYQISEHRNATGDGSTFDWVTPVDGTGNWQEYIGILRCGATGTFSSSMFFAIAGANKVIETYIAYASVFDVTDVDKYLEDRIKQNEQQTAIAKAQADNALATVNIANGKVSFLSTTIDNNVVATGSLLVGDVVGNNAGISGVTDRGRQSVRVYAGAPYANKNTAPFTLQDDGLIKMHHPNGNKGFELGVVNGKLVFNVYDDIGNLIMEMGSQGIIFSNYIPDSWTNLKLAKFDSANYSPYDATSVTNFANTNTRQIMVNNPGGIEDAQHWNVFVPKTEASHINYSTYSAGRSYDSNTYVIYEGIYFEGTLQKPQKPNSSTAKLADGWYYNIVFLSVWKKYGDPYQTGAYSYTFQLFRLSAGKVVETKDYTINGQV